jgi:hypothetical protein
MHSARFHEILIFLFFFCIPPPRIRWHNGGLPSARLDGDSNTVGRCITVWNLSASGVVTGPTSRYSCITYLRVAVSGILSAGLHARARASLLNPKYGRLWMRYECYTNDFELSKPFICQIGANVDQNYLSLKRSSNKRQITVVVWDVFYDVQYIAKKFTHSQYFEIRFIPILNRF